MKKYKLIYCDPPWSYNNKASNGAADNHYDTTSFYKLTRLPIETIAEENSVLVMWYTGNFALEAIKLAEAWRFSVKTMKCFTWVKLNRLAEQRFNQALESQSMIDFYDLLDRLMSETRMNGGNYTRANTEDALIAVRGNGLERVSASVKQVIYSCLGEHSEKPAEARFRLEQLYGDVSRIELFARDRVAGWDAWGNEIDGDIDIGVGYNSKAKQQDMPLGDDTIWPSEVDFIFRIIKEESDLPISLQNKLRHHINRLWLEKIPVPEIMDTARSLAIAMEN